MKPGRVLVAMFIFLGLIGLSISFESGGNLGYASPSAAIAPQQSCGSYSCTGAFEDTTPPDTTITSNPDDPTNRVAAEFSFSSNESGSSFECNLDGEGFIPCSPPQSYVALYEGSHSFEVRAKDKAGNIDPTPATHSWTVQYSWRIETVDAPASYVWTWLAFPVLDLDNSGFPHLAYVGDYLGYSHFDGAEWHTETVDDLGSWGTALTTDSSGNSHIVYFDLINENLKYATNESGSWVHQTIRNNLDDPSSSIAVDSSGFVHIITCESGGTYYFTNASGVWMEEPGPSSNCDSIPSLVVDNNDILHVGYANFGEVNYAQNDNPGPWFEENADPDCQTLSSTDSVSLTLDSLGNAHISYACVTIEALVVRYATNSSGSWETIDIYQFFDHISWPFAFQSSLAVDPSVNIHVGFSGEQELVYITNRSGNWHFIPISNYYGYPGDNISIGVDNSSAVKIAYTGYCNIAQCIRLTELSQPGWAGQTVYDEGFVFDASLAIDSDNYHHIAFGSGADMNLLYTTNKTGPWTFEEVDYIGPGVYNTLSIGLDTDSYAHIIYYSDLSSLKYATNNSGEWTTTTIDPEASSGVINSLALDGNGKVHIAYTDDWHMGIKYATNVTGTWMLDTVYSGPSDSSSINVDQNGYAHIFFRGGFNLMYVTNTPGSWEFETIDLDCLGPIYTKIDSAQKFHLAYLSNDGLTYATNSSGSWQIEVVDSDPTWERLSIYLDQSESVFIAYIDANNDQLKLASNTSGSWEIEFLEFKGPWSFTSLAIDSSDYNHIMYSLDGDLMYITDLFGKLNTIKTIYAPIFNSINVDNQDNPHIAYYRKGKIMHAYNQSGAWLTEEVDTPDSSPYSVSIDIDSLNNVHLAYNPTYANNIGGSWNFEHLAYLYMPDLAIDQNGKAHISIQNGGLSYYTNLSGTWDYEDIEIGTHIGQRNSIALDSENNAYIAYSHDHSLISENALNFATNKSGSWTYEYVDYECKYCSLAIDDEAFAHIAYVRNDYLRFATNKSGSWGNFLLDSSSYSSSLSLDVKGNDYISYGRSGKLKLATNVSGSWVKRELASGPTRLTSIIVDSKGYVHISYFYNYDLKYCTNSPDVYPPFQSDWNPPDESLISTDTPTLTLTLNENGDCRWSLLDQAYDEITENCSGGGSTSMTCQISGLPEGTTVVYGVSLKYGHIENPR